MAKNYSSSDQNPITRVPRYHSSPPYAGDHHPPSWARLGIGLLITALDAVSERTKRWEKRDLSTHTSSSPTNNTADSSFSHSPNPMSELPPRQRQIFIGMVFDVQNRIQKQLFHLRQIERTSARLVQPLIKPIYHNPLLKPLVRTYEYLAARGQAEIDRWQELGAIEEEKSQQIAQNFTRHTVDESISFLSSNPEIQELIQTHSSSLLSEIVEEIRERAITINTIVEGKIRHVLRLKPRSTIPPPPDEVRARANLFSPNTFQ